MPMGSPPGVGNQWEGRDRGATEPLAVLWPSSWGSRLWASWEPRDDTLFTLSVPLGKGGDGQP